MNTKPSILSLASEKGRRTAMSLSALALLGFGTARACAPNTPEVAPRVELVDPELNKALTCARELFQDTAFYSPIGSSDWAEEHCPGYESRLKELQKTEDPLATIVDIRKGILQRAGVDGNIEQWIQPASSYDTEIYVLVDEDAVSKGKELGRVK